MVPNDSFILQPSWSYFSLFVFSGAAGCPTHPSSCCLRHGKGFLGPEWWVSLWRRRSSSKRLSKPGISCEGFFPNWEGQRVLPRSDVYWVHLLQWNHSEIHFSLDLSLRAELESLKPTGTGLDHLFGLISLLLGPFCYILWEFQVAREGEHLP